MLFSGLIAGAAFQQAKPSEIRAAAIETIFKLRPVLIALTAMLGGLVALGLARFQ
jgi:hypothetical protein